MIIKIHGGNISLNSPLIKASWIPTIYFKRIKTDRDLVLIITVRYDVQSSCIIYMHMHVLYDSAEI